MCIKLGQTLKPQLRKVTGSEDPKNLIGMLTLHARTVIMNVQLKSVAFSGQAKYKNKRISSEYFLKSRRFL